jgi:hypothetical protein
VITGRGAARAGRLAIASLLLALAAAPTAGAGTGPLARGVSDARLLLSPAPVVRRAAMARAASAGASVVRLSVGWRSMVDPAAPGPAEPRDPASPSYDFGRLDAAVRDAVDLGLEPLVMVTGAPAWAEAPDRWEYAWPGTWAPRPAALGDFAAALARRYSGAWRGLPRVRLWQAWNEPNLPRYLQPQWVARRGRWEPYAPRHYRAMLDAFERSVRSVQPDAVVASAGTGPIGEPRDGEGRMSPLRFWASLLCVAPDPPHRRLGCSTPRFDVAAHHPLSVGDPDRPAAARHDIAIADLAKLRRVLAAAGVAPRLWATELNWDAGRSGVPAGRQARYVARGLRLLAREGVDLAVWHFLADPPPGPHAHPAGLWEDPAGLRPRRFLAAFALPLTARRADARRVEVWAGADGPMALERRTADGWRRVATIPGGRATVALRGRARLRARAAGRVSPSVTVGVRTRAEPPRRAFALRGPARRGAVPSPQPPPVSPGPPVGGPDAPPSPLGPVAPGRDRG